MDFSLSGTTVASLVMIDNEVIAFNVGDSRILLISDDDIDQITTDHSALVEYERIEQSGGIVE